MIKIHPSEERKITDNYLSKGNILIFLTFLICLTGTLLVFGFSRITDKQEEVTIKIKKTKKDIQELKSQISLIAPVSHQLHDYFEESAVIIEGLLGYIQSDSEKGESVSAKIGMNEAVFLTSFLKEELSVAALHNTAAYQEIDVTRHGLKGDGLTDNHGPIHKLLASLTKHEGQVKLIFPAGKYFIKGKPGENALNLEGLEDISFIGKGDATLLFDGHVMSRNIIMLQNCKNLEFRNLSIDIDPLVCTLGEIISVASGNQIVIRIRGDYPLPDPSYWTASILRGLARDRETGIMMREKGDPRVIKLEDLGNREYQLTLDDNALSGNQNMTSGFMAGQLFSLHPRARPGAGNTLFVENSSHLLFSQFNIYAGDGHLVMIAGSAGIKFLDCDVMPREGRHIMNNADGFHCQSNKKGIYLDRCRILGMNDDCMNFYSKLYSVSNVENSRKFTLLANANTDTRSPSRFKVGDNIAFLNANTGEFDGTTTIKTIKAVDLGNQKNLLQVETTDDVPGIISRRSAGRPDKMTNREYTESGGDNYRKAMALKVPFEHMVMNLNLKNDGFIIRNCEFGYNRATGFKCKATNGVIRNTIFHDQVVLFQAELSWLEGIYPSKIEATDVTINKGIRYQATLPGKNLSAEEVVRFMRYINFKNVVDGSGKDIPAPDEMKN